MEGIILAVFSIFLFLCLLLDLPLVLALLAGLILFFSYGLLTGHPFRDMLRLSLSGIKTTQTVLAVMFLIGMLTAAWRISGTIPYIVYHASQWCQPGDILIISFILCSLLSLLTGTSFGTVATVGVICMTIANSMQISPIYMGGAILAGSYFGDRCSPMSSSALLIAAITKTNIFTNCRLMMQTAAVPFVISCIVYGLAGLLYHGSASAATTAAIFPRFFTLTWETLVPAGMVILFSLLRIDVKYTMLLSIAASIVLAAAVQHMPLSAIIWALLFGFQPAAPELSRILAGGGIISMINVLAIICLSASYAGIFSGTAFLNRIHQRMRGLSRRITPFGAILTTSLATAMISCNQTLAIMLTHELCKTIEPDPQRLAIHLENTAVIITPLVPWAIACSVPLAILNAPITAIPAACYLYLIPAWNYLRNHRTAQPS